MSGALPHKASSAASRMAAVAHCRAIMAEHQKAKPERDSLPGRTWAAMPLRARAGLIQGGTGYPADVADLMARQPWASFELGEQAAIGACARQMLRDLRNAASLF